MINYPENKKECSHLHKTNIETKADYVQEFVIVREDFSILFVTW